MIENVMQKSEQLGALTRLFRHAVLNHGGTDEEIDKFLGNPDSPESLEIAARMGQGFNQPIWKRVVEPVVVSYKNNGRAYEIEGRLSRDKKIWCSHPGTRYGSVNYPFSEEVVLKLQFLQKVNSLEDAARQLEGRRVATYTDLLLYIEAIDSFPRSIIALGSCMRDDPNDNYSQRTYPAYRLIGDRGARPENKRRVIGRIGTGRHYWFSEYEPCFFLVRA